MEKWRRTLTATAVGTVLAALAAPAFSSAATDGKTPSVVEQGKEIAFDRKKGNCLACHMIEGGELPGNIGPPLVAIQDRFPSREKLYNQIYDSTKVNPNSAMPPFGRHGILTDKEIEKVVEFVYSL